MKYISIIEAKCNYYQLLDELCDEIHTALKINGEVDLNCADNIVIRTNEELLDEQLQEVMGKGFYKYIICYTCEDYDYHYILHGEWEKVDR